MKMRGGEWLFVLTLLLFAAGLRTAGITFGQPPAGYYPGLTPQGMIHEFTVLHPDEYFSVAIPVEMHLHRTYNPGFLKYPSLIINTNYVLFGLTGALDGLTLEDRAGHSVRTYAPFELYVFSRLYSVLGGVLVVAAVYATARPWGGHYAAALAGLLAATSYVLVQHSHYIKPESLAAAWMMLAVWASFTALRTNRDRPRRLLYLLAGFFTGLAATTRYNALAVAAVVGLVGLVLLYRHRGRRDVAAVLLAWLLVPLVFVAGTPYSVLDFRLFYADFTYIMGQFLTTAAHIQEYFVTGPLVGLAVMYHYMLLFGLGLPAALLLPAAFYGLWRSRPPARFFLRRNSPPLFALILLVSIAVYSFVVLRTIRPITSDNLLTLILPQVILLCGLGGGWLYERLPRRELLGPLLAVAVVALPLLYSLSFVLALGQRDTRYHLLVWAQEHLPPGSSVLLNGPYNLPLDPTLYSSELFAGGYAPVETLPDYGVDYMVYSDAMTFNISRAGRIVPPDVMRDWLAYPAVLDAVYPRVVAVGRPAWPGSDEMMNMAGYWHHPGLVVYCMHAAACEAVGLSQP